MNRNLVNDFIAADAKLHEASASAFMALEAEHAAELARIEAKADANTALITAEIAALKAEIATLKKQVEERT